MQLSRMGAVVEACWCEIPAHFPQVRNPVFVVMLTPHSLGANVRSFKSAVSRRIHPMPEFENVQIWQRNYDERILRGQRDYDRIAVYIQANPVNWSLDRESQGRTR